MTVDLKMSFSIILLINMVRHPVREPKERKPPGGGYDLDWKAPRQRLCELVRAGGVPYG